MVKFSFDNGFKKTRRGQFPWPTKSRILYATKIHMCKYGREISNDPELKGRKINIHDDVIKWKHFPRNWPFVRKIHRSPVNFPHKGQWRGALMFSLIYVWINDWANNRKAGDLRRQYGHYDVIVMICKENCLFSPRAIVRRITTEVDFAPENKTALGAKQWIYIWSHDFPLEQQQPIQRNVTTGARIRIYVLMHKVNIGPCNGLISLRYHFTTWNNAGLLYKEPRQTKFKSIYKPFLSI